MSVSSSFLKITYLFILFLVVLGFPCCVPAFSSCGKRGLLFIAVCGFLIAVASRGRAWAPGLEASVAVARKLESVASAVVAQGIICSMACGIFPDQGLNLCPLHWQADSHPLYYQGVLPFLSKQWSYRTRASPNDLMLSGLHLQRPYFQIRSQSQV